MTAPTTPTTPTVVARYFAAADADDPAALADCFVADGTVEDEGETYRGRDAIIAWRQAVISKYTYTRTITGTEQRGDTEFRISARIEGNFPGGVADLKFDFSIADDQITSVVIAP
jgi:SnoaL-like domain